MLRISIQESNKTINVEVRDINHAMKHPIILQNNIQRDNIRILV